MFDLYRAEDLMERIEVLLTLMEGKMSKVPTAEEFMTDEYQIKNYGTILLKPGQAAIEFAKLHVEACKKEIAENAKLKNLDNGLPVIKVIDKESILNAYPLTNIK